MRWIIRGLVLVLCMTAFDANAAFERPVIVTGDTIDFNGTRYAVNGLDTPEIERSLCPEERKFGQLAKAFAEELVRGVAVVKPQGLTRPRVRSRALCNR